MSDTQLNAVPDDLKRLLDASGAEVSLHRHIDHATQYHVTRGSETATLNVYTTGKISTGGKSSALKTLLEDWRTSQMSAGGGAAAGHPSEPDGTPRVGTDEAGKGDYFGPLVVAGVRVLGEEAARKLRDIGVRDSKTLSVIGATNLAPRIVETVGPENTRVVVLRPREYEARRKDAGNNVNKLLSEINVRIFEELEAEVELFIVDEFGKAARTCIGPRLPTGIRLVVRPRAEDDVAVAAASVLARARFLEEMHVLSEEVGFELPRGATHVLDAARRVVEERGVEGLAEVAKVHFVTTKRVLDAAGLST